MAKVMAWILGIILNYFVVYAAYFIVDEFL
jgi:hypothetical protein